MAKLSVSIRADGLNQVVRGLLAMGVEVDDLKDAFGDIAKTGAALASRYAPKQSGRLAKDVRGSKSRNKAVISAGRLSVPYAGVQNFGWAAHNITGVGFMQKADRTLQPLALRRLEQNINAAIRRRGLG